MRSTLTSPSNNFDNYLKTQGNPSQQSLLDESYQSQSLTRINMPKDFKKLQKKVQDSKKKRENINLGKVQSDILVPHSIDTLMLKYGPTPQGVGNRAHNQGLKKDKQGEEIASYKKDAMRLIFNRVYRQIGNVFTELQRKVMRDDIMRLKRNAQDLKDQEESRPSRRVTRQSNYENDSNRHNTEEGGSAPGQKSKFRQIYEMKKQTIKATYDYKSDESQQNQELDSQRSIEGPTGKNYIKENHHHHHHYYGQTDSEQNSVDQQDKDSEINNQLYSSQNNDKNKQKSQNKRYQSEDDVDYKDDYSEVSEEDQNLNRIDIIKKKKRAKSPALQSKVADYPIIQEINESFEISPEKLLLQQQQQQEDLIQPSTTAKSYFQDNNGSNTQKAKGSGLIVKSIRQQDAVEMSFNENPFDRKQSSFNQNGNFQANGLMIYNQSSPDFKAKDATQSFGQRQNSFKSQRHQILSNQQKQENFQESHNENSLSKISEISSDHLQNQLKKSKFSDKLKLLMTQFENVKAPAYSQFTDENSSIENLDLDKDIGSIRQKLQTANSNEDEESKQGQETTKSSRMAMMKKQLKNKDNKEMNIQEQNSEGIPTPIGLMFKISDNAVLFEEQKQKIVKETQIAPPPTAFKIQSKKNQAASSLQKAQSQTQEITESEIMVKVEKMNKSALLFFQIIRNKQMTLQKQSFDSLKLLQQMIKKQTVDQSKKRSIQKITLFLQNKELILLNKKFQKYRKSSFLYTFDMKLLKLSKFFNNKVSFWKKESFKEIIGFCIKNEGNKMKIEQLNSENQNQKQKVIKLELTRVGKVSKNFLLRYGFRRIQQHFIQQNQIAHAIKKIHSTIQNQQSLSNIKSTSRSFKKWANLLQYMKRIEDKKAASCKMIITGLKKIDQQSCIFKFQAWKLESQRQTKEEQQLLIHKRELERMIFLEQVLVNLRQSLLTKGFSQIKIISKLKNQLKFILEKQGQKQLKKSRAQLFLQWKQRVYKQKMVVVKLSVFIKSLDCKMQKLSKNYFLRWRGYLQELKAQRQAEGARLIKKLLKNFENKRKQMTLVNWKVKYLNKKAVEEKNQMQKQFQNRVLSGFFSKIKINLERVGFQAIKHHDEEVKDQIQERKITIAISKISSATKVCKIIENKRIDRIYFQKWSTFSKSFELIIQGTQIIKHLERKYLQKYLTQFKQQQQYLLIQQTKRQISLNLIRVILYKIQKDQIQKSFNVWLLQDNKKKIQNWNIASGNKIRSKPPKSNANPQPENSATITVTRIFGQHSRTNSANNSMMNQSKNSGQNNRYSNMGDDEDENDFYSKEDLFNDNKQSLNNFQNTMSRNSSLEIIICNSGEQDHHSNLKLKNSSSAKSLQRSKEQNHQTSSSPKFGESQREITLSFFLDSERQQTEENNNIRIKSSASKEEQKSNKKVEQQQSEKTKKKSQSKGSRNKNLSLNRYLNNTDKESSKLKPSKQAITPRAGGQFTSTQGALDYTSTLKSTQQSTRSNEFTQELQVKQPPRQEIETLDENDAIEMVKSANLSRMLSPKSQTPLESVPEETYPIKRRSPKKTLKQQNSSSVISQASRQSNKLSSFLSSNTQSASQKQKKESSGKALTSIESQQKSKLMQINKSSKQVSAHKKNRSIGDQDSQMLPLNNYEDHNELTNINVVKINQNIKKGLESIQQLFIRKQYKETLEKIITTSFSEDYDEIYFQRLKIRQQNKLKRIFIIRAKLQKRNPFLVWESFALWKRLDYLQMLNSLKQFKESLNSIYCPKKLE